MSSRPVAALQGGVMGEGSPWPNRLTTAGIVLLPTVAVLVVGLLAAFGRTAFLAGFAVALLLLVTLLWRLRDQPFVLALSFLIWLSIERFSVALLSPVLAPDELRALLAYKELFLPGLGVILLPRLLPMLRAAPVAVRAVDLLALGFGALIVIGVLLSPAPLDDRVLYARRLALLPMVYMVGRLMPWRAASMRSMLGAVVIAAFAIAVFGLLERFLIGEILWRELVPAAYYYHLSGLAGLNTPGTDFPLNGLPTVFFDQSAGVPARRLVSTFLEATTLASFLAFSAVVSLALPWRLAVRLLVTGTIVVAGFLTLSRAGLVILLLGIAYILVIWRVRRLRDPLWLVSLAGGLVGALVVIALAVEVSGATTGALAHFEGLRDGVESLIGAPLGRGVGVAGGFAGSLVGSESTFGVVLVQIGLPGMLLWAAWLLGAAILAAIHGSRLRGIGFAGPAVGICLIGFFGTAALTESAGGFLGNWIYGFIGGALVTAGTAKVAASGADPVRRATGAALPAPVPIADVSLHPVDFDGAVDWISRRAAAGAGGTVCTPNADYVVRARTDEPFRRAIQASDLRVPDGMAVVYAAWIAGRPIRTTVTGRLLVPAVAERAATEGWPIALFGAGPGIAEEAAGRLKERYPGLEVAAAVSPPMGLDVGSPVDDELVERLVASGARVIFVALGAPKQELWIQHHRGRMPSTVVVGVGAALDILSGRFREAPRWMTNLGLEWLFRLAQEPRRLAHRYLVDDPWVFWWAIKTRLGRGPRTPASEEEAQ